MVEKSHVLGKIYLVTWLNILKGWTSSKKIDTNTNNAVHVTREIVAYPFFLCSANHLDDTWHSIVNTCLDLTWQVHFEK